MSTLFLPMIMTVEAGRSEEEEEEEGMVTLGVGSREEHTGEGGGVIKGVVTGGGKEVCAGVEGWEEDNGKRSQEVMMMNSCFAC